MKTLYLLRHAKSSWDDPGLRDYDRPLARRGQRAAPAMGAYMQEHGLVPEVVLCSSARRTRETWDLVAAHLDTPPPVTFLDELYGAGPRTMLLALEREAPDAASAMLVGHNPGTQDLATGLAGSGSESLLDRMSWKYPTGALAVLEVDAASWSDVVPGQARLQAFVRPRDLTG